YSGRADWEAIATLKQALNVPVLGNGDIWEAADAVRMVRETGCDGVVIGRGCLGRPWLFADLATAFAADPDPAPDSAGDVRKGTLLDTRRQEGALPDIGPRPRLPALGEVAAVMRRHAELLAEWLGERDGC